MRFSSIVFSMVAVSTALAGPLRSMPRSTAPAFRLRIKAANADLDGKYVSVHDDAAGVYPSVTGAEGATTLSTSSGSAAGLFELHTLPVGMVDHALGLVGTNGVLNLVDVAAPAGRVFDNGTTYSWRDFNLGHVDSATNQPVAETGKVVVSIDDKEGKWTAWPGKGVDEWTIKWMDGSGVSIQVYQPVELVYEKVDA